MEESGASLNPQVLRVQLRAMADMELSPSAEAMFGLFAGLVATMNMLQPEGYSETVPALKFGASKE